MHYTTILTVKRKIIWTGYLVCFQVPTQFNNFFMGNGYLENSGVVVIILLHRVQACTAAIGLVVSL